MIQITASLDSLNNEMIAQIEPVIAAEADRHWAVTVDADTERVNDWAWDRFVSVDGSQFTFEFDGTWDDLVDAYRESAYDAYHG